MLQTGNFWGYANNEQLYSSQVIEKKKNEKNKQLYNATQIQYYTRKASTNFR